MLLPPLVLVAPPEGPKVVVLLRDGCPCTRECRPMLNALADACRGRVRFEAVLDADEAHAERLRSGAGLRFPVLPDPKGARIRALGGKEALDLRLVGTGGGVLGAWEGLSRANVAALAARLRETKGILIRVDPTPFTTLPKLGCEFPPAP